MEIQEFLNRVLGARAAVSANQEILYDRKEHSHSSIMQKDMRWLRAHPRQDRFIRPALGTEFGVHETFVDYDGKRHYAPKLWVLVQSHGWYFTVVPIYAGECFWDVDSDGYLLLAKRDEESPNGKADVLRWRMHKYGGVNQRERDAYELAVAGYLTVCCLAPATQRSNDMDSILKAIAVHQQRVTLARLGYTLVKVRTASKEAFEPGWQKPSNARTVEQWERDPTSNDALNTGLLTNGMRAIDVDIEDVALAASIVEQCRAILGPAPKRFRQGSGSCMLFYRSGKASPKPVTLMGTLGKVEARANGQQAVVYGIHQTGALYQWDTDLLTIPRASLTEVSDEQLETFFAAIYQQIGAESSVTKLSETRTQVAVTPAPEPSPIDAKRNAANARTVLAKECRTLAAMKPGSHRNNALNEASFTVGTVIAWLDPSEGAQALYQAAVDNGYVAKRGVEAAQATIVSGLKAGALKPRAPLPEGDGLPPVDISSLQVSGKPVGVALGVRESKASVLPTPKAGASRSVVLTALAGVQETAIEWHWPGYLPAGMLTLLSGAGGTGKSTLAFGFAATITTGGLWPDGQRCTQCGNVLIWSSEDDIARTIKPRLIAAGADINRIGVIESTTDDTGAKLPFDPARDIEGLRTEVRRIGGLSLLIVDPIVSAVSGDMHKANDVRRSLQPIIDFATEFNCAVLGITHFAKNTGGRNASERVIGSQAFAALARMVLVTAKEEDSDQRVFTRAKSNISKDDGGLHYTIHEVSVPKQGGGVLAATRVVWGGAIHGNARAILSSVEGEDGERKPINRVEEAMHFLQAEIANGPIAARELIERAKRDFGITERSLQRARERLGIVPTKAGYQGAWVWSYRINPSFPGQP